MTNRSVNNQVKFTVQCIFCMFLLLFTLSLKAQTVYKWQDENGVIHFGHSIPPDQVTSEHQRLNNQAVVIEHIEHADVPELVKEVRLSQNQVASRVKKRLLLATYDNESEIETERDRAFEFLDKENNTITSQIKSLRENLKDAEDLFDDISDSKRLTHTTLQDTVNSLRQSLRRQNERQRELHQQRLSVQQRYIAEIANYREAVDANNANLLALPED